MKSSRPACDSLIALNPGLFRYGGANVEGVLGTFIPERLPKPGPELAPGLGCIWVKLLPRPGIPVGVGVWRVGNDVLYGSLVRVPPGGGRIGLTGTKDAIPPAPPGEERLPAVPDLLGDPEDSSGVVGGVSVTRDTISAMLFDPCSTGVPALAPGGADAVVPAAVAGGIGATDEMG